MDNIYVVRGTEQSGPFTEAKFARNWPRAPSQATRWSGGTAWRNGRRFPRRRWAPRQQAPAGPGTVTPAPAPARPRFRRGQSPAATGNRTSTLAIVSLVDEILGLICWPSAIGVASAASDHRPPGAQGNQRQSCARRQWPGLAVGLIIGYIEASPHCGFGGGLFGAHRRGGEGGDQGPEFFADPERGHEYRALDEQRAEPVGATK